ncbi:unnamed protein product, partial [Choristocarpus tenellus]
VTYLADLCKCILSGQWGVFGEVGEDGTWRLRLNEFAHVLKMASRVPDGVEGTLLRRLDSLPYTARQVVLRVVCITVIGGRGAMDLLLHLLTHVAPFSQARNTLLCPPPPLGSFCLHAALHYSCHTREISAKSPVAVQGWSFFTLSRCISNYLSCYWEAVVRSHSLMNAHHGGHSRLSVEGSTYSGVLNNTAHDPNRRFSYPSRRVKPVAMNGKGIGGAKGSSYEGEGGGWCSGVGEDGMVLVSTSIPIALYCPLVELPPPPGSRQALLVYLELLETGGFLRVEQGNQSFVCDDMMLLDKVYANTPFKLRKALHREAAAWLSDRHRTSFRDRAEVMPVLIHHLTQAHQEGRAQAMLAILKVLGGRFLDRWVLQHVRTLVAMRENVNNPASMEFMVSGGNTQFCCGPTLPTL